MLVVYRSVILIASIILLIMLTIQLFYTANLAATKLDQGSRTDSGIFPKRTRNINAWYLSTATNSESANAYPILYPQNPPSEGGASGTAYFAGQAARIGIARTTLCPIFRAQDDGSTDPLLIG